MFEGLIWFKIERLPKCLKTGVYYLHLNQLYCLRSSLFSLHKNLKYCVRIIYNAWTWLKFINYHLMGWEIRWTMIISHKYIWKLVNKMIFYPPASEASRGVYWNQAKKILPTRILSTLGCLSLCFSVTLSLCNSVTL